MYADVLEMAPRATSPRKAPPAPRPPRAASNLSQRLTEMRARLRWTMARTCVPEAVQPRIVAFDRGLGVAARLANALAANGPEATSKSEASLSLNDLTVLAYRGLDAGFVDDALAVLGSVGMLIGGVPRAAFETALGLVRAGRNPDACVCLTDAIEGMDDTDGVLSTLLAQLLCEAGDRRWIAIAQRVLATGSDRDARVRCMELLASQHRT